MGAIKKALSPVSAYSQRSTALWQDMLDRLSDAVLPDDIDAFEAWVDANVLSIPVGWVEPLHELAEKRREEIAAEDVGSIMRERFDF